MALFWKFLKRFFVAFAILWPIAVLISMGWMKLFVLDKVSIPFGWWISLSGLRFLTLVSFPIFVSLIYASARTSWKGMFTDQPGENPENRKAGLILLTGFLLVVFVFSYFHTNYFQPLLLRHFYSQLYEASNFLPEKILEPGKFYDGIEGYQIRVDSKNEETGMFYKIMIYDHTVGVGNNSLTMADSGRIVIDKRRLKVYLKLYHGNSHNDNESNGKKGIPGIHTKVSFDTLNATYDLPRASVAGFDLEILKGRNEMQTKPELDTSIQTFLFQKFQVEMDYRKKIAMMIGRDPSGLKALGWTKEDALLVKILDSLKKDEKSMLIVRSIQSYQQMIEKRMIDLNQQETKFKSEKQKRNATSISLIALLLLGIANSFWAVKLPRIVPLVIATVFIIFFNFLQEISIRLFAEMSVNWAPWISPLAWIAISLMLIYIFRRRLFKRSSIDPDSAQS